jgi:hypothetical protein
VSAPAATHISLKSLNPAPPPPLNQYGFEYVPGLESDGAYITWYLDGKLAWRMNAAAVGADARAQISARTIPEEPMYLILNLALSSGFGYVDFDKLTFPATMSVGKSLRCPPELLTSTDAVAHALLLQTTCASISRRTRSTSAATRRTSVSLACAGLRRMLTRDCSNGRLHPETPRGLHELKPHDMGQHSRRRRLRARLAAQPPVLRRVRRRAAQVSWPRARVGHGRLARSDDEESRKRFHHVSLALWAASAPSIFPCSVYLSFESPRCDSYAPSSRNAIARAAIPSLPVVLFSTDSWRLFQHRN